MAGKLTYIAPIENASGKIFGLKTRFCSVTRQSGDRIKGCAFLGKRDLVNHPVSQTEMNIRANFTQLTKRVAARLKAGNPRWDADHALFNAQKQYDSFKKWLWAYVKEHAVGLDYITYGGMNYYPGGEKLEMAVSTNNKLSLVLTPGLGEKIGSSVNAKVNNTACSGVTVTDDTVTITLPASLDGDELRSVTLITDSDVLKLEF